MERVLLPRAPVLLVLLLFGRVCCAKVCQGNTNALSLLGTEENHYKNMVRIYFNCTTILENLEITHTLRHHDLSFLETIEEVGGYVLIAFNEVETIPLSRLRLIRGQSLYGGQYSLSVLSNYFYSQEHSQNISIGVRSLQLSNLTEILNGGVQITHNRLLCHVDSIQWWDILDKSANPTLMLNHSDYPKSCPKCDGGCVNGSCWAPGPQHCQKFSRLICADQCSHRCRGPGPSDCCHDECAAGCTGPHATHCLACRSFSDEGTCKKTCDGPMVYDQNTHRIITNPDAKFTYGATCVTACPHNYVVTDWACVRNCRPGKYEVLENGVHRCKDCDGPCPKECDGIHMGALAKALAVDSTNIESFKNCTKINGDLSILPTTFKGDRYLKVPPMDPYKLEYFRTLREITGSLLIQSWPANMSSLSVFENLEIIRGRSLHRGHSLVLVQAGRIQWLGLRSLKEISHGTVFLKSNPELCYTSEDQWAALFKTKTDQSVRLIENAPAQTCSERNASCDPQCSGAGCWGPGPSLCVSCLHFDRGGRCVESCHLLHGAPREVELNGSCVACHPECELQDGAPTCSGPGAHQCRRCAHAQDGPLCVGKCPQGVPLQGEQLLWMFADAQQQCQLCHANCTKGCTGPGLSHCIDESRPPVLAAVVVGCLLVLVVLSLVVFVFLRRRRITRKRTMRRLLQERELVEPLTPSGQAPNQALLRILKETEIKKVRVLGSGAFGTVYKGLWFPEGENVKIRVAIKVLREATSPKANQEILDEAYVMASVEHPHVCRLLGVLLTSSVQLVTQLMPFGCLLQYVQQHQQLLGAQRLLNWCVQIAKGMSYLEERHLVHRDLAARNVLVKSPNHVKITDFGLAKLLTADESEYQADGGKVPIKWMALESILQWTYTHQSDVWSYGVTVWELMTFGSKPYDGIPAVEISSVLERGERLPQPPICTIDVYMIMVKCWMIDPFSRPRFRELVRDFSEMARDPHRYLVLQGEQSSPGDQRLFSRLLSADGEEELDVEEYLMPYREGGARQRGGSCVAMAANGGSRRENNASLRYITDPTLRDESQDVPGHDYMNQAMSLEDGDAGLSDVFNPNYEDLSLACSPEPQYLNAPHVPARDVPHVPARDAFRDMLDNLEYIGPDCANPDLRNTTTLTHNALFLPAAENLEYMGLAPVR
uniref:Receptor protein-tyrosine kinase n=1 Tax=Neogobius melanostomus TaxID=47308 RepID=A0A8C6WLY2_9GOBI